MSTPGDMIIIGAAESDRVFGLSVERTTGPVLCPVCREPVPESRGSTPRKYCSSRCTLRAQRLRNRGLLDGVVAETGTARRRGTWHTCPICRKQVWVRPSEEPWWRTCKGACAAARRRSPLLPWNPLQQNLVERIAASNLTLKDVATATGLSRTTIRKWYQERGRYLTSTSLSRIAAYLGLSAEAALEAAGGKTGEEEMARAGHATIDANRPTPGTVAFRRARKKAGAATKDRPHSESHTAAIRDSLIRAGAPAYGAAKLRAVQATASGAACQRLWIRLRWHPRPSRAEIRSWAQEVGRRIGQSPAAVLDAWIPHLEDRALWSPRGRKSNERRHHIIAALRERWPGRMHGFWDAAAELVGVAEKRDWSAFELAQWWAQHQHYCLGAEPDSAAATDAVTAAVVRLAALEPGRVRHLRERGSAEILRLVGLTARGGAGTKQ
jgi:transcriptional regulator with XRE-family HTH domain